MTRASSRRAAKQQAHSNAMNETTGTRRVRRTRDAALKARNGNPLQVLLANRMIELGGDTPLTLQDVVDRAGKRDGYPRISKPTVGNILMGRTTQLRPETIKALAKALRLDEADISRAIDLASDVSLELPAKLRRALTADEFRALVAFGEHLVASRQRG